MAIVDISTLRALIEKYANENKIDPKLLEAMILQESSKQGTKGNTVNTDAISPKGAVGVGQLMPDTAARFGVTNRNDPEQNIRGAATYVGWLSNRFNGDLNKILAGYNAGEGAVDRYNGVPPFKETRDYVKAISAKYAEMSKAVPSNSLGSIVNAANNSTTGVKPWNPSTIPAVAATQALAANQPLAAAPNQSTVSDMQMTATGAEMANSVLSTANSTQIPAPIDTSSNPAVVRAREIAAQTNGDATTQAIKGLQKAAELQQEGSDGISNLVANIPGLPDYGAAQQAQVSALQQLYDSTAKATSGTLEQMTARDLERRRIGQVIQDSQNYDPLNPNSDWRAQTGTLAKLARQTNATILAEQRLNNANVIENPADFFEKLIYGNRYTTGREALDAQAKSLEGNMLRVQGQLDSQTKVARDINLPDPTILQSKLNSDLQLASLQKDIGIAKAEAPINAFNSQAQGITALANLYGASANAQTDVANTQIKQAELIQQQNETAIKAATLPLAVEQQVVSLESSKQGLIQQQAQTAQIPNQIANSNITLQSNALQLAKDLQTAPMDVAERQLASMAKTVETQAMLPILRAKLNTVKQLEASGQLQSQVGAAALADYNNAIVAFQESAAKASTGAAAKAVAAANAQNEAIVRLGPITEKVNTKEAETRLEEFAKAEKDQEILAAGWDALGMPVGQMPSAEILKGAKYSKGVIPALVAANTGGRVAANTPKAVAVLTELGATSQNQKYPALSFTVGNAYKVSAQLVAAETGDKTVALETLDQSVINKEFNRRKSIPNPIASTSNPTDVYGILPPALVSRFTKSRGSKVIAQHFGTIEAENKKVGNFASMIGEAQKALTAAGIAKGVAQDVAISEYFKATIEANNNLRGYSIIGVPEQSQVLVEIDRFDAGLSSITGYGDQTYDISTPVGLAALRSISGFERHTNAFAAPFNDVTGLPAFRSPENQNQTGLDPNPEATTVYQWQR